MNDFWNQRYSAEEYAYGTKPNQFYSEILKTLKPGKILFPGEGEGRNAVFAATKGWQVYAFDLSTEGKRKAEMLASEKNVSINYTISGYEDVQFKAEIFDCVVLISAHLHPQKRAEIHKKMVSFLKPGGTLILEGFSKKQINYNSGGPGDVNMLFSTKELKNDFEMLTELQISEEEITLDEGPFHQGKASVIRVQGVK